MHDTLNDVGIVYLHSEPYAIAVMATNLSTLDAGYRFIQGVSRLAYDQLSRFGLWRASNDPGAVAPLAATTESVVAPSNDPQRDLRMWTPSNVPASALPASALPVSVPAVPAVHPPEM